MKQAKHKQHLNLLRKRAHTGLSTLCSYLVSENIVACYISEMLWEVIYYTSNIDVRGIKKLKD